MALTAEKKKNEKVRSRCSRSTCYAYFPDTHDYLSAAFYFCFYTFLYACKCTYIFRAPRGGLSRKRQRRVPENFARHRRTIVEKQTPEVQLLVTFKPRGHLLSAVHFGNYTAFAEGVASSVTTSRVAQYHIQRQSSVRCTSNQKFFKLMCWTVPSVACMCKCKYRISWMLTISTKRIVTRFNAALIAMFVTCRAVALETSI